MTDLLSEVLADLETESDLLDAAVAGLDAAGWRRPTPSPGWDVATQIAHLAWTDEAACSAATDRARWDALVMEALADPDGVVDRSALAGGAAPTGDLLARWRSGRAALARALRNHPTGERMPWFGPPMSASSMATARFMETWAHGLDVYDALERPRRPTDRIRHVAHLGVRTRGFSFRSRGLEVPSGEPRVELVAPSGERWDWGPPDAGQRVSGPAYDFCLLVTQRVHRDDTALRAEGADAERWLEIAQCFAGASGTGRAAG